MIPYRYIRSGVGSFVPAEGSTVVTRSGERIQVAETTDQIRQLLETTVDG